MMFEFLLGILRQIKTDACCAIKIDGILKLGEIIDQREGLDRVQFSIGIGDACVATQASNLHRIETGVLAASDGHILLHHGLSGEPRQRLSCSMGPVDLLMACARQDAIRIAVVAKHLPVAAGWYVTDMAE